MLRELRRLTKLPCTATVLSARDVVTQARELPESWLSTSTRAALSAAAVPAETALLTLRGPPHYTPPCCYWGIDCGPLFCQEASLSVEAKGPQAAPGSTCDPLEYRMNIYGTCRQENRKAALSLCWGPYTHEMCPSATCSESRSTSR